MALLYNVFGTTNLQECLATKVAQPYSEWVHVWTVMKVHSDNPHNLFQLKKPSHISLYASLRLTSWVSMKTR